MKGKFKQGDKRESRVWRGGALKGDNGGRGGDKRRKKEREGGRCKKYKVSTKPSLASLQ